MFCSNCQTGLEGKHCNNCGQKSSVGELNMPALLHEFWHGVTHTDKGILKLIKDLFLHPKKVYLGYFSGQRKTYFSPVTFFLISATLLILIGEKIFDYEDYVHRFTSPNGYNEFGRYAFAATKFNTFITLPFEILLTWLLFRKQFNLAKNIVFWLYFHGLMFTLQIILTPIYFALITQKNNIDGLFVLATYIFLFWHLFIIFGEKKITDFILIFLIVNFYHIISNLVTAYNLFGDGVYKFTKTNTIFELILYFYRH
jgi:hypothetical protein